MKLNSSPRLYCRCPPLLFSQLAGAQQDLASFPENAHFDLLVDEILTCTIPPYQDGSNYLPVPRYCFSRVLLQNMTEQLLDELAVAYAVLSPFGAVFDGSRRLYV
jgi:hypothetical protein